MWMGFVAYSDGSVFSCLVPFDKKRDIDDQRFEIEEFLLERKRGEAEIVCINVTRY